MCMHTPVPQLSLQDKYMRPKLSLVTNSKQSKWKAKQGQECWSNHPPWATRSGPCTCAGDYSAGNCKLGGTSYLKGRKELQVWAKWSLQGQNGFYNVRPWLRRWLVDNAQCLPDILCQSEVPQPAVEVEVGKAWHASMRWDEWVLWKKGTSSQHRWNSAVSAFDNFPLVQPKYSLNTFCWQPETNLMLN